jgi:hypothetical protein
MESDYGLVVGKFRDFTIQIPCPREKIPFQRNLTKRFQLLLLPPRNSKLVPTHHIIHLFFRCKVAPVLPLPLLGRSRSDCPS